MNGIALDNKISNQVEFSLKTDTVLKVLLDFKYINILTKIFGSSVDIKLLV